MAKKSDTIQFLNKELKALATTNGRTPIIIQNTVDTKAVTRAEKKVRKLPKAVLPEIGKVIL